jgi:hypothetical protein
MTFLWVCNVAWWLFKDAETCCNKLYRVMQEGWSIFWGGEKNVHMSMCLILNGYRVRALGTSRPNSVRFFMGSWMKSEIYEWKVDTRDKFFARMLDAAARIKKREDQLRRTTRDLRTRVAKCIEVDGGIFEYFLRAVINLSFLCNKFFI